MPDWLLPSLLVAGVLASAPAMAREDDRQQPATIEADRAEIDRASGESLYFGNVVFEQGTLRLTGDRVAIVTREGTVDRAEAQGEPARIRQENDQGQMVRAHGRTIDYDAGEGLIVLTGNAELQREGERFAAGKIRYWPDSGRVEGGRGDDGGRVQIRIEPESGNGNGDGDDSP
ncbi:MAG: lipopolysaccharide transport periplasmic protein LptA [Halofilum sp. (in: g-proteobacteria)]|nr:lipopolysaccharide transport periplasmic protein LptA [Halofilum sp. (in: g-proteobacteria)]